MDRFDLTATVGLLAVVATAALADPEPLFLAAVLGGFLLSLSAWRLYQGHVWEAFGWLAWVAAAALLPVGLEGRPVGLLAFLASLIAGLALQFGGRFGLLPDVWTVE